MGEHTISKHINEKSYEMYCFMWRQYVNTDAWYPLRSYKEGDILLNRARLNRISAILERFYYPQIQQL